MNFKRITDTALYNLRTHYNLVLANLLEQLDFNPYDSHDHELCLQYHRMGSVITLIDEELSSRMFD